jgi:transglutaminase-like putative cysteine protease
MKRIFTYFIVFIICIIAGNEISFFANWVFAESDKKSFINKNIQYSFTIQNTTNHLISKADFWVYAPVKKNSIQKNKSLTSSHPYELITDKLNNQILHYTFSNIAPFASLIISINAKLLMQNSPLIDKGENLKFFLQPEKYIESDKSEIKKLARSLRGKTINETAERTFKWVAANIKYDGYSSYDHGALYVLKEKKGDCTEFSYLFVALCRANGIPARAVGGYICSENTILSAEKYHNWAEVYLDKAWQIADAQKNVYLQDQANYIALRIIDSNKNPVGDNHRFRLEGEGIKVKMN